MGGQTVWWYFTGWLVEEITKTQFVARVKQSEAKN